MYRFSPAPDIRNFLILTFGFSWALMGYVIYLGGLEKAGPLILLIMWVPGLVSLSYRKIKALGFSDVGWQLGHLRYWIYGFMVPLIVAVICYTIYWSTHISEFQLPSADKLARNGVASPLILILKLYPIEFLVGCIAALGEELGWRGFLIPKLTKTSVKYPLIVSSLIWGLWHLPLILWGGYATSDIPALSIFLFTIAVVCAGVFAGWLRIVSGSVWVAMLYHAAHNMFLQTAFEVFNKPGPLSQYLGGETGLIPCLVYIFILGIGYNLFSRHANAVE